MAANDALFGVLMRFADTLSERFDVADVLYGLTDHTVEVLDASAAGVSLSDTAGTLAFVSANSEMAAELERVQQNWRQGPCHQAYRTGVSVVIDDIDDHGEWPKYRDRAAEVGLRAVLGIPLTVADQCLGALNVYDEDVREWTPGDVDAAGILANIATSYVLHASHLDEADRINEQLQHALDSRVVIEQAKGILAGEYGISVDVGFEILRHHARSNQATLRSVAEAVVELGLRPKPSEAP